jgi:hypothetical protein
VRSIALLIIPQAFVGAFPWWYYGFRIGMGYDNRMDMRLIDVIAFAILVGCAWAARRQLRTAAPSPIFRLGLLLLLASALFLCAVVAWASICVYIGTHLLRGKKNSFSHPLKIRVITVPIASFSGGVGTLKISSSFSSFAFVIIFIFLPNIFPPSGFIHVSPAVQVSESFSNLVGIFVGNSPHLKVS